MTQDANHLPWWEFHLRQARGEPLSEAEQQQYDAEMARQDQAAPLSIDLEGLKKARAEALALAQENAALHARVQEVENAISMTAREL